jgi:hypothetical protein
MTRGFQKLVGQRITKVDARAVNSVIITTEAGDKFQINADDIVHSSAPIPILRLERVETLSGDRP